MAQRNFFHASQMPTMDRDQIRTPPHPDPHPHLGAVNGSFMLHVDGSASAVVSRLNDHPSSSFSNYMATNSVPLHDPYFHPSSSASSIRFPPNQGLCMPLPSFNQHGGSMVNSHADIERAAYKRKRPAVPQAYNGGSISGYYSAGSSSNVQMSSDLLQTMPIASSQYWPVDPASITHNYRSDNHLIAGEDSQRNVRRRHTHAIHPEINPAVGFLSSNSPRHFHTAGTSLGISMEGQSSHVQLPMASQGRNLSSDHRVVHEGSRSLAGPSVINTSVGSNVVLHPNITQSRNSSSLPTVHDPLARGIGAGGICYYQRSNPYRSSSSYTSVGFAPAPLEGDGGHHGVGPVPASRYSRPLSIAGRSSHRNGRMRSSYGRFQSGYNEDAAHSRWSSEGSGMMDQATYYGSRNWFDHHRDMRLDINSMSYEELLALEERIGNVSTGLSEETISGCLQEIPHRSSNLSDDEEEQKCAICLEEYKDQDRRGRLSCRHDFHAGCIKKWLLIKNACPICKAAADSPKEKQA